MIDLWLIDLEKNTIILDCSMDEKQAAEYHVWGGYRVAWPQWDQFIWIGVENGTVVWIIGKRKMEWTGLMWTLRRMSLRLFNPWSDRPGWFPLWALTKDEPFVP